MHDDITLRALIQLCILAQITIIGMLYLVTFLTHRSRLPFYRADSYAVNKSLLIAITLLLGVTMFLLLFSEGNREWRDALKVGDWMLIPATSAIKWTMIADAVFMSYLTLSTMPTPSNPFTPILFLLAPLSIFLELDLGALLWVVGIIILNFSLICLAMDGDSFQRISRGRFAYWIVTVLCFGVATYVGVVTRRL